MPVVMRPQDGLNGQEDEEGESASEDEDKELSNSTEDIIARSK